jgi:hypothetical protein
MTEEELLAPLKPTEPSDHEIAALLKRADRRTRTRRIRIATAGVLATAAATAVLASLPDQQQPPATAAAILTKTAAVAKQQSEPAPWTGYRYVKSTDTRTEGDATIESTEEVWVDSEWQGRRISTPRVVSGVLKPRRMPEAMLKKLTPKQRAQYEEYLTKPVVIKPYDMTTPKDMPNLYGDGPLAKVPLEDLPTDPDELGKLLVEAHKDGRWTPGGGWDPAPGTVHYDVLRDILLLLTEANASPDQRAALIGVLGNYAGVTALPVAVDHRGRSGRGVEIAVQGQDPVRVIFAPDTSELLEWSQGGEVHTFLAFGHVNSMDERP